MTWIVKQCPHCKEEIDQLEFEETVTVSKIVYRPDFEPKSWVTRLGSEVSYTSGLRCPKCSKTVVATVDAGKTFFEEE